MGLGDLGADSLTNLCATVLGSCRPRLCAQRDEGDGRGRCRSALAASRILMVTERVRGSPAGRMGPVARGLGSPRHAVPHSAPQRTRLPSRFWMLPLAFAPVDTRGWFGL